MSAAGRSEETGNILIGKNQGFGITLGEFKNVHYGGGSGLIINFSHRSVFN